MYRILHIIPTLDRGGAEKQLALLATQLPRENFEVHVCALTRGGPWQSVLEDAEIPVSVIGKLWKADPAALWKLTQQVKACRPDLVQTWLFAANTYGRLAARWAGVKHIVAAERCADQWKVWHEFAVDRWLAKRTDCIVTNSSGVRDFYVAHGISAEKMRVIANGIPPRNVVGVERGAWLASLDLPEDAQAIVAVGRLWPQKKVEDLIWAAELLYGIRRNIHLLIVGDGPRRRNLERFSRQTEIGDQVRFLGHRSDVPQLLQHADCFWLGSGYEGQSNALMEAMQAGLPVVATDIPGNRDLVEDGQSGHLVKVGDAAAFARHTEQILTHPDSARKIGLAAQRRMEQHFSVPQMVRRYADLYRTILEPKQAP